MEAQRQSFQLELEHMGGKVQQLELEVKALKGSGQQMARKTLAPSRRRATVKEKNRKNKWTCQTIITKAKETHRPARIQQKQAYRTSQNQVLNRQSVSKNRATQQSQPQPQHRSPSSPGPKSSTKIASQVSKILGVQR